jgi:hypothetical protein
MKPPGPLLTSSIALAAILPTSAALAVEFSVHAQAVTAATAAGEAWASLHDWIGDSYSRAPALMLVLAVLIALPPLALAGMMLRSQRRSPDTTILLRPANRRAEAPPKTRTVRTEMSSWPTEAWVEVPSESGARYVVGLTMLRIGREVDNDICLSERTVHRYHAVIRRTSEGDVVITDLSGADGNGAFINGKRISEGRLAPGDIISIGEVKLKFDARLV